MARPVNVDLAGQSQPSSDCVVLSLGDTIKEWRREKCRTRTRGLYRQGCTVMQDGQALRAQRVLLGRGSALWFHASLSFNTGDAKSPAGHG